MIPKDRPSGRSSSFLNSEYFNRTFVSGMAVI